MYNNLHCILNTIYNNVRSNIRFEDGSLSTETAVALEKKYSGKNMKIFLHFTIYYITTEKLQMSQKLFEFKLTKKRRK